MSDNAIASYRRSWQSLGNSIVERHYRIRNNSLLNQRAGIPDLNRSHRWQISRQVKNGTTINRWVTFTRKTILPWTWSWRWDHTGELHSQRLTKSRTACGFWNTPLTTMALILSFIDKATVFSAGNRIMINVIDCFLQLVDQLCLGVRFNMQINTPTDRAACWVSLSIFNSEFSKRPEHWSVITNFII